MNKNTVKNSKSKKVASKKTVKASTAPETTVAVTVTPATVASVNAQPKRGRGRPPQTFSQSVVSLADLVKVLPANSDLILPNPFVRSLNSLGLKIKSTPFRANGLIEIAKTYKANLPSSNVSVVNLNEPAAVN